MSPSIQNIGAQIFEEIKKSQSILLHCHPSPDADSIGGALAMMHVLESIGKKVTVIKGDSDLPASLNFLPGFEKILNKNFFEIDLAEFDLFLIQDSGGLNQISKIAPIVFPENLKTIVIDHHATNNGFGQINLVDTSFPANCHLLYELFVSWSIDITPQIAKCLMLGIYTDTGGFKYSSTTSKTLAAASHLAEIFPDYTDMISKMENSNTPGVVAYEGLALSNVSLHCNGHMAISAVSYAQLQDKKIDKSEIFPSIANILTSVVGWDIGVKIVEEPKNTMHLSFRTRDFNKHDVSKIASALGGGGHKAAAGARLSEASVEDAVKKVVETIKNIFPDF